jgi:maleate cis-trans isomerase
MSALEVPSLLPRFRWGTIAPRPNREVTIGAGYEFYRIVPLDIIEVRTELGIGDNYFEPVFWEVAPAIERFWTCVELLRHERVDHVVLTGAPVAAQLGRTRTREMLDEAAQRTGIPFGSPLESVITAMQDLGLSRLAIASRWSTQLNAALTRYFREGGIQITAITVRGQWPKEAFNMSIEDGIEMSLDVGREAGRKGVDAEAIFVVGGAAISLHAIPVLEAEFAKPVFTNLSADVYTTLVAPGVIAPIEGWGRLLGGK